MPREQTLAENEYRLAIGLEAKRFRRYPALARERGWEGTAEVWLLLGAPVPSIDLAKSSGHALLDREALALLRAAVQRVQVPPLLLQRRARVRVAIEYRLDD